MKKDTIYIDIEDDITAIIGKIDKSDSKIVALVPPKRSTVLNSAVNMKLLVKTAEEQGKRVVLVTSEQSLLSLAAGVGLYATPNLHSKPEIPEPGDAPSMPEDVIDGEELDVTAPVGELDKMQQAKDGADEGLLPEKASKSNKGLSAPKIKIPSFESFRSKLLLIGGGIAFIALGWWWAFTIAPRANIAIEAQTTRVDVAFEFNADIATPTSDLTKNRFAAEKVEIKRTVTEQFTPTGKKNVGDKASGQMTIQNCDTSSPFTIETGTIFTSPSGLKFESLSDAAVPGGTFSGGDCDSPGEVTVTVRAVAPGDDQNLANGTIYDIDGVGSLVTGYGGQMSGGTDREVTVVAQKDIDDAKIRLEEQDRSGVLAELKEQLADDVVGINETYSATLGTVTSQPVVGAEAASGNVATDITFTLLGIKRETLRNAVENVLNARITGGDQSIYSNGLDTLIFGLIKKTSATNFDLRLRTDGFIGPKLDTIAVANDITGKRYGEALKIIEDRPGVVKVEIDLEPFWVFSLPKADKIDIELKVNEQQPSG